MTSCLFICVCVRVVIEQSARDRSITKKYFPQLRDWISRFLDSNKDMTASLIGHNMLVEQVRVASRVIVMHSQYK